MAIFGLDTRLRDTVGTGDNEVKCELQTQRERKRGKESLYEAPSIGPPKESE